MITLNSTRPVDCCRCLSFDNGLAGALHVAQSVDRREGEEGFSQKNLVLALLASLLVQQSDAELPIDRDHRGNSLDPLGVGGGGAQASTTQQYQPDTTDSSARRRAGLTAVVLDDKSPFVGLFQELGLLERVCDADWVRFERVDDRTSSGGGSRAPEVAVDRYENTWLGDGESLELPLAALVMQP